VCSIMWNRLTLKNWLIDFLFIALVDSSYLNIDLCKVESLQKDKNWAQSVNCLKAYSKLRAFNCHRNNRTDKVDWHKCSVVNIWVSSTPLAPAHENICSYTPTVGHQHTRIFVSAFKHTTSFMLVLLQQKFPRMLVTATGNSPENFNQIKQEHFELCIFL